MVSDEAGKSNQAPARRFRGLGCGCAAAIGFLAGIGLPVLFVLSFGLSPCEHGPCDPDGANDFNVAAVVLLALALLVFLGVWQLMRRRSKDRP
jgi:hypothetical protein